MGDRIGSDEMVGDDEAEDTVETTTQDLWFSGTEEPEWLVDATHEPDQEMRVKVNRNGINILRV